MSKKTIHSIFLALTLAGLGTIAEPAAAQLQATGGYAERPLVLPKGLLRVDTAPSDYGYMDFGAINNGRGLRFGIDTDGAGDSVFLGAGAAIGVIDDLELGLLALPLLFSPDFDFGNMEVYGRYGLMDGRFKLAAQAAIRIPTNNRFGVGLGVPVIYAINGSLRLDSGLELEILTNDNGANNNDTVSLDFPLAFAFDINDTIFLGPRTGVRLPGFNDMVIPAGFFIGGTIKNVVDLSGSITWTDFINTYPGDNFVMNRFEIVTGATFFIDVF